MNMSDQQNSRHENKSCLHGNVPLEGTAARTRPFSLEEALLRRKNKLMGSDRKCSSNDPNTTAERKDSNRTSDLADFSHKYEKHIEDIKSSISGKKDVQSETDEEHLTNEQKCKSGHELASNSVVKAIDSDAKHRSRDNNEACHHHRGKTKDKVKTEPEREVRKKHAKSVIEGDKQERKYKAEGCYKTETERGTSKKRTKHAVEDGGYDRSRRNEQLKSDLEKDSIKKRSKHDDLKDKDDQRGRIKDPFKDEHVKESKRTRSKDISFKENDDRRIRDDDRYRGKYEIDDVKQRYKLAATKDRDVMRDRSPSRDDRRLFQGYDSKSKSEFDRSNFRRYDSHRVEYEDYSDRKYRRYEETATRRRRTRSRSPDYGWERSVSLSPRSRRRYRYGKDYADNSSLNPKECSTRKHSEPDKYRTSGGAGYEGGYHQHRSSGLGGYSPRKRKTEAIAKSPSPIICSPESKTKVDQSTTASTVNSQPTAASVPDQPSSMTVTSSIKNAQTTLSSVGATTMLDTSLDYVQLTQATRPKRRLYIENLPTSVSDKDMIDWLNDVLLSSGANHIPGSSPCISCIINKERSQAVVEFLTPEYATKALAFDGKSFSGSTLKIRRPKDFTDTTAAILEKPVAIKQTVLTEACHSVSDVVENSPNKIFIGGISKLLSAEMLMEIANAFGILKSYRLETNEFAGLCAFLEYLDPSVTVKACCGLNGMKLGGHVLTAVLAFPDHLLKQDLESVPAYTVPDHAIPLLQNPTKVLKLKYVFNPEDFVLLSESELEETMEDVRLECSRFGTIKSINCVKDNCCPDVNTISSEQRPKVEPEEMDEAKEVPVTEPVPCPYSTTAAGFPTAFENASADNDKESAVSEVKYMPSFLAENDANNSMQPDFSAVNEVQPPAVGKALSEGEAVSASEGGLDLKEGNVKTETVELLNDSEQTAVIKSEPYLDDETVNQTLDVKKLEDVKPEVHSGEDEYNLGNDADHQIMNVQKHEDTHPEVFSCEAEPNARDEDGNQILDTDMHEDSKPDANCSEPEPRLNNDEQIDRADMEQQLYDDEVVNDQLIQEPIGDDRQPWAHDPDVFEVGCILVEFLREEAACTAAHCLNGRLYDNRAVEVSYVPHSRYLDRFLG